AEPMERRSNLLLIQHGIILDCMRRVGPAENRYRVSLPNHEYMPPPRQTGKLDPTRVTLEDVVGLLSQVQDPKRKTHQALTAGLLGVSPLLAKEIVFRASGTVDERAADASPEALFDALAAVIGPLGRREWQPGVVEGESGVEAFSVYPIEHLPGWQPVAGVSEAISRYYGGAVGEDSYNAAKAPVREALDEAQAKLRAKLASLERSMTDDSEREQLRQSGELILAYQYTLQPGQTEL